RVARRLEQPAREPPKARVIVDDQHGSDHRQIVAHVTSGVLPDSRDLSANSGIAMTTSGRPARTVAEFTHEGGVMFLAKTILVAAAVAVAALASPQATPNERHETPTLRNVVRGLVRDGAPGALAVVRTPAGTSRAAAGLGRRRPRVELSATDRFRI